MARPPRLHLTGAAISIVMARLREVVSARHQAEVSLCEKLQRKNQDRESLPVFLFRYNYSEISFLFQQYPVPVVKIGMH